MSKPTVADGAWCAKELRRLPVDERNAVLAAAAQVAEPEYRTNPSLTNFDAFGEEDLHGQSTAAPER
jgi:hypothetical protein